MMGLSQETSMKAISSKCMKECGHALIFFLLEIVPNNIIEQYSLKKNDIFFMCCDGLSDWITPENMNIRKRKLSAHGVCFTFFSIAY